jgi:hypothetical protein
MVTQPIFLGWMGHFGQIDSADLFLFLDDAQLERTSRKDSPWQTANKIKGANGPIWLRVPTVRVKGQKINETRINYETDWVKKHLESLRQSYSKVRYSGEALEIVGAHLNSKPEILADLTCNLTTDIARALGIKTEIRRTSELGIGGVKTDRLRAILREVGATEYIANPGSKAYMGENPDLGCKVTWFDYIHPEYPQIHGDFMAYMSVVDLMMNTGNALEIIRKGVPCTLTDTRSELVLASSSQNFQATTMAAWRRPSRWSLRPSDAAPMP